MYKLMTTEGLTGQSKELAVIIMGSKGDRSHADEIIKVLDDFKIKYNLRVGSAHKTPEHVLNIIREYDQQSRPIVYVTVAGRSDALSAFVDSATHHPVIACPPYSEKFGGTSIFSSLNVPSGIGNTVTAYPEQAALALVKIFALGNPIIRELVSRYQQNARGVVTSADRELTK